MTSDKFCYVNYVWQRNKTRQVCKYKALYLHSKMQEVAAGAVEWITHASQFLLIPGIIINNYSAYISTSTFKSN